MRSLRLLALGVGTAHSFGVGPAGGGGRGSSSATALGLTTGHAAQLVAASSAALAKQQAERGRIEAEFEAGSAPGAGSSSSSSSSDGLDASALADEMTSLSAPTATVAADAARALVRRLFALPPTAREGSASCPDGRGTGSGGRGPLHPDVVYYPIVGFKRVRVPSADGGPDEYHAIPTHHTVGASCAVPNLPPRMAEEVVGWFSPVCPLGSLDADDGHYCGEQFQ